MALGLLGLLDLSIVTDRLIKQLEACRDVSPLWETIDRFTIQVTGNPPDALRAAGDCQLSLYLFHVESDKFQKNSPVTGASTPPIPFQPLSLNLYYLLSAFSSNENGYVEEQRAMSIALRCFHEHPLIRTNVILDGKTVKEEFCLTMEVETADSLERLWQATTTAMRLATVYRVSVVFVTPPAPATAPAPVWTFRLVPEVLPFTLPGQLLSTSANLSYVAPDGQTYRLSPSPALVATGQRFSLYGTGFTSPIAAHLYLLPASGAATDITSWIQTRESTRIELVVPTASPPAPGVYQLQIGDALPITDPSASRSNSTPFSVAAWVDPTGGATISGVIGATLTLTGRGFISDKTEIFLGRLKLVPTSGSPGAGQFQVVSDSSLQFQLPATIAAGRYPVRVRVNQVESLPAKWVEVA